jgi:ABC-type amino acid transport system permease subunit
VIWTWAITIASLIGVVANIYHKRWCFHIWFFTNSAWAIIDFYRGIPAQGVLFTIYTALAIWGIFKWKEK